MKEGLRRLQPLKLQENRYGYLTVGLQVNKKRKHCKMHRLLAKAFIPNPDNKSEVDHIDCNKQNNSLNNLLWATNQENLGNRQQTPKPKTSKYIGVSWHKRDRKWHAQIKINTKQIHIGYFDDPKRQHIIKS